jgi:uncharacterized protein YndB with AHSA1/START domain
VVTDADSQTPSDPADIGCATIVAAPPEDVFEFLSRLENHWRIAGRFLRVVSVDHDDRGGTVQMRGPLGVRRTARTTVTAVRAPRLIIGVAELPGGTRARVSWTLAGRLGETRVRLTAHVEHATRLDRALLALGGRAWLQRRFVDTLRELSCAIENSVAPVAAPVPQAILGS